MNNNILIIFMAVVGGAFALVVIAYLFVMKALNKSDIKRMQQLRQGTESNKLTMDVIYQKLYMKYIKIPFIRRYLIKVRRRLEIINIEDEYLTRSQSSKILTKTLLFVLPITLIIVLLTKTNYLLMCILLLFEIFLIETIIDGMVDKIDDKLLAQQVNFFSEIRHAYHEFNMVEEAIYQVSQNEDDVEISRQAEKIYEILISDDPEAELEKYYDIAPNSYLKEFAGVSYLTKEFGDRKIDKGSLYLKNVNNITQEMQLEILKRDKLNYVFQSLSVIAVVPILCIEPLKNWAVSNFGFTEQFYAGKLGVIVQILIILITVISYILVRKIKDNSSTNANVKNTENPWQAKVYKKPIAKQIVNMFMPKEGTKDNRKLKELLKDAASSQKMEWLYVTRITLCIAVFILSIFFFSYLHKVSVDYIYNEPTSDYNIIGTMSEKDKKKAMNVTEQDNYFLDMFKGKPKTTVEEILLAMKYSEYYSEDKGISEEKMQEDAERVYTKLQTINGEYLKWFEILLAIVFALAGYMSPIWILYFQMKMRQLEMEDEVMQFQTIILMLMRIERVNVEIILEWLERYANIFKAPITKCVNNYEAGAWEALEEFKNDISYMPLVRIVESMQAAVEKIPIADAFDELDTERSYYQEKRKESNNRLISRKGMIGKVIGFAPMVCLFVGYLIVPLVVIGMLSMTSSFTTMSGSI